MKSKPSNFDYEKFEQKVKQFSSKLPGSRELMAMYYSMLDVHTPWHYKVIMLGCFSYVLCPVDAIPDAIVGLGFGDDAGAIATTYATVTHMV